jgi:predicted dienelactone hydrolase
MKKLFLLAIIIPLLAYWYFVPIFKPFTKLTGNYSVGLKTVEWIDINRIDSYAAQKGKQRSLVAHVWYPASVTGKQKEMLYLGKKLPFLQQAFSQFYKIPLPISQLLLKNIKSRSYFNVELSKEKKQWPVILFTHGLLGSPSDMYSVILEDLASHGYVVIGLDLPYFNFLTLHEDGKVSSSAALSTQFNRISQDEQKEFMSKAIEIYKQDLRFVIDQLQRINKDPESIFYNRLDLDHLGIMGHSAGGTAAIEFCRVDKRCKAAVNLDGWYDHIITSTPLAVPLLMMFGEKSIEIIEPSQEYLQRKELTKEQYFAREDAIVAHKEQLCKGDNCKMVIIPNAEHAAFGDEVLLKWPLRAWHLGDAYTIINKTNKEIVKFFNTHLKQKQ